VKSEINKFVIRPISVYADKWWQSDDFRYRQYAKELLVELIEISGEIKRSWPIDLSSSIDGGMYPEINKLVKKRDLISDSIRIFSAMAVEGFINFYGALRLGDEVFTENFERLPQNKKVKALLLFCDSIKIDNLSPLILASNQLSNSRNSLVHPKTKEFDSLPSYPDRSSSPMPETAQKAVDSMSSFFREFVHLVPEADWLVSREN
jgi:hypothetical protein